MDDWILAASLDEHEEMALSIKQTTMDDGGTVSVGASRHASAMSAGFADQVKGSLEMHDQVIQKLCKVNRQFRRKALERCAEDAGALRVEHARMFNHSRRAVLRTASGTRTHRADDEAIEYGNA